jgi:ElaB/YqjD/DUF883 family membrane-anchored ribosome-binding protein
MDRPRHEFEKATSMNMNERTTDADGDRVTAGKLMVDVKVLAADAEELLKATAGRTGQRIAQVRVNAQESLKAAGARLADLPSRVLKETHGAGLAADDYAGANPWRVIGIGAVVGLVLGIFIGHRKDSNSQRHESQE